MNSFSVMRVLHVGDAVAHDHRIALLPLHLVDGVDERLVVPVRRPFERSLDRADLGVVGADDEQAMTPEPGVASGRVPVSSTAGGRGVAPGARLRASRPVQPRLRSRRSPVRPRQYPDDERELRVERRFGELVHSATAQPQSAASR